MLVPNLALVDCNIKEIPKNNTCFEVSNEITEILLLARILLSDLIESC